MRNYKEHLIKEGTPLREALVHLDKLASDAILFVVDEGDHLKGSLTDGDVRRGLIRGMEVDNPVDNVMHLNPKYIKKGERDIRKVIEFREQHFRIIPILDQHGKVVNVVNFREIQSYLPVDAVIMAGGEGNRLRPLTIKVPKPLLEVGGIPIMEHVLNRLAMYGIDDFWVAVKYLGEQIENYFGDGSDRNIKIQYINEDKPMGTIGAVSTVENFVHDYILVTNSDLLSNIDYELFFLSFLQQDADLTVLSIPYHVNIPYAVLETENGYVKSLKEKPTYTYYSNGGVYLMKRSVLKHLPKNTVCDATELMEKLIREGLKVTSYPLVGYWLDIGKPEDYEQACKDIKHIKF